MFDFVNGVVTGVAQILDKFKVDATTAAQMTHDLQKLGMELQDKAAEREQQVLLAQAEINKVEAASPNLFVSGWRPAAGWVCVTGFGTAYIISPMIKLLAPLCGYVGPALPALEMGELTPMLVALLGLGGYRTFERYNNVHRTNGN